MKIWKSLSSRERLIVKLGFPCLFALLFYYYYWQPNLEKLNYLRTDVPQQKATLAWMQHQIEEAEPHLAQPANQSASLPLLTVIERAAIQTRVNNAIQRVQPGGDGSVKIWFQDIAADSWFQLIDLLAKSGIGVEATNITRSTAGLITIRVTLVR